MLYERIETVEARVHRGPSLTVIHDRLGVQTARSGDYLVGCERGKIRVMTATDFESEFCLVEEAMPAKLAAAEARVKRLEFELEQRMRVAPDPPSDPPQAEEGEATFAAAVARCDRLKFELEQTMRAPAAAGVAQDRG